MRLLEIQRKERDLLGPLARVDVGPPPAPAVRVA